MGKRRKTFFTESARGNKLGYIQYLDRLTELSMAMFKWKNLPETIDVRYLELALFLDGQAVFFIDPDMDIYLALKVMTTAPLNVYGVPSRRRAYAVNGYQRELTPDNSVIIYNNLLHTNSTIMVEEFAKRLYQYDQIIYVNARAQKTPTLVQGSESQRLTLLNLYKEFVGNSPVIFGDKNLDINSLKVIKTDAPYVADKIYQLKTQTWNEALTYLGISNLSIQKKERIITDEVIRSQGGTVASRYSRLESRRRACEEINSMFGLNVDVDFREDFRQTDDEFMLEGESGDDNPDAMVIDTHTRSAYAKVGERS